MTCKGKSRRTALPCKKHAMRGREYCRAHGGRIPRGIARPSTTDARHSKDLPTHFLAHYDFTKNDPTLLEQKDEIALMEARVHDLLRRVDAGESGHVWKLLRAAVAAGGVAYGAQDHAKLGTVLAAMAA